MSYTPSIIEMSEKPKRREVTHDEAPAIISDHAFEPRTEWWSLCKHCGLAEAAHSETTVDHRKRISISYYGDTNPEAFE